MAASPSGRGRPSKQAKAAASDMTSHLLGASELCGLIGYEEAVAATLPVCRSAWNDPSFQCVAAFVPVGPRRRTRLMYVANEGDMARLRQYLATPKRSGHIDLGDSEGDTALTFAIMCGRVDAAVELQQAGARLDRYRCLMLTRMACIDEDYSHTLPILARLCPQWVDPPSGGTTLLCNTWGDEWVDSFHYSLLTIAAQAPNAEGIRQLLALGAPTEACDSRGKTALMEAAIVKSCDCLTVLLQAGADAFTVSDSNKSILHYVCMRVLSVDLPAEQEEGTAQALGILLEHIKAQEGKEEKPPSVFSSEGAGGEVAGAGTGAEAGEAVAEVGSWPWQTMHGHLMHGGDKPKDGRPPARRISRLDPLLKLVSDARPWEMNAEAGIGTTALGICVARSMWKCGKMLLDAGADPAVKDKKGRDCLLALPQLLDQEQHVRPEQPEEAQGEQEPDEEGEDEEEEILRAYGL